MTKELVGHRCGVRDILAMRTDNTMVTHPRQSNPMQVDMFKKSRTVMGEGLFVEANAAGDHVGATTTDNRRLYPAQLDS